MKKVFLDCGSNMGMGFCELAKHYAIDSSWQIFAFEPNIHSITEYKKNIESRKFDCLNNKNIHLINKAVWDCDELLEFFMEGVNPEAYETNLEWKSFCDNLTQGHKEGKNLDFIDLNLPATGGSCVKFIKDKLKRPKEHEIKLKFQDPVFVEAFDFSKWVNENFSDEHFIILKMDIEGSEYKVLPKMIAENSISKIKKLVIEWHDWQLPEFEKTTQQLKTQIKNLNIELIDWY